MNCGHDRSELMELARRGNASVMLPCADCARFFEEQRSLSAMLRAYPAAANMPDIESWVMAEFDRVHRSRRWIVPALAAIAAAITIAVLLGNHDAAPQRRRNLAIVGTKVVAPPETVTRVAERKPLRTRRRPKTPAPVKNMEAPFLQIPYTMPLDPDERASIVRMEMPVSSLIAAGLPVRGTDTAALAQADVVVGTDGLARAVRLISISSNQ